MTDRSEWLRWRRRGIGASDVAAIVGLSPWQSAWAVWLDKVTDEIPDDDPADHLTLGLDLEPLIATWWERRNPGLHVHARQSRVHHPENRWALATLDGLVLEEGTDDPALALEVFESKYSSDGAWDEVPMQYQIQCQWQLYVTGLDTVALAVMHLPFGRPAFRMYDVKRDPESIDVLVERCSRFWFDHVVAQVPPPADGSDSTSQALAAAWPNPQPLPIEPVDDLADLIGEWRAFKDAKRQLDADIKAHENMIKARLADRTEGCIGGQVVVSWRPQGRTDIDRDAVRADWGDKYDTHTSVRVLRHHEPKAPRRTA